MTNSHSVERLFPDLPDKMKRLPIDKRGFPIPFFVSMESGEPDFRVIGPGKIAMCFQLRRCWICGDPLGVNLAFVIGPMCAINRLTSEPPSHRDCAVFAAKNCPFLSKPMAKRRVEGLPAERKEAPGVHFDRNPGAAAVWITKSFKPISGRQSGVGNKGVLFSLGDPIDVLWFAHGRDATRKEIEHSIVTGLPSLRQVAFQQGTAALAALEGMIIKARDLLPAPEPEADSLDII